LIGGGDGDVESTSDFRATQLFPGGQHQDLLVWLAQSVKRGEHFVMFSSLQ